MAAGRLRGASPLGALLRLPLLGRARPGTNLTIAAPGKLRTDGSKRGTGDGSEDRFGSRGFESGPAVFGTSR